MGDCPYWQPAIAVIIMQLFMYFTLSPGSVDRSNVTF